MKHREKVIFGNPSLGTHKGFVHIYSPGGGEGGGKAERNEDEVRVREKKSSQLDHHQAATKKLNGANGEGESSSESEHVFNRNNSSSSSSSNSRIFPLLDHGDFDYSRMVAICGVPPEQVPDGVLNFARNYRSLMTHIRVVVSNEHGHGQGQGQEQEHEHEHEQERQDGDGNDGDDNEDIDRDGYDHDSHHGSNNNNNNNSNTTAKKFLVLVSLKTSRAATSFVENLHGKPFNNFEKDVTASVFHVSRLETETENSNDEDDNNNDQAASIAAANEEEEEEEEGKTASHQTSNGKVRNEANVNVNANANVNKNANHRKEAIHKSMSSPPAKKTAQQQQVQASSTSMVERRRRRQETDEVNNCPVCLESMESQDTSVCVAAAAATSNNYNNGNGGGGGGGGNDFSTPLFTTVCNHTFHMDCLLRCEDAPCPVCRYDHTGVNEMQVQCHKCGSTSGVMVCLICGVASCGGIGGGNGSSGGNCSSSSGEGKRGILRPTLTQGGQQLSSIGEYDNDENANCRGNLASPLAYGGHYGADADASAGGCCAWDHYNETLHAYALDTETQHVWDFAGQGYVHRLIQNEDDGKLVEVPDPTNLFSEERSLIPSLTDAEENEVVHRKLEGYASEYHHLLQDQLEQQRRYFHGVLEDIRRDHEENMKKSTPSHLISALKQELNQLQQRHETLQRKYNKVSKNVAFMKNMNESLEANKEPMRKEIAKIQNQRKEYQSMLERTVPQLEERVRQLMMRLEGDE